MTDTPTPNSGVVDSGAETPSKFMMGIEGPADNEEIYDEALRNAFGIEPDATDAESDADEPNPDDADGDTPDNDSEEIPPGEGGQDQGGEADNDTATGEGVDFASLFELRYGRPPEPAEYQGLLELADWANNLSPEQQQAINAALSNPQAFTQPQPQPAATPNNERVSQTDLTALEEQYGEDDPMVVLLRRQQQELEQLRNATIEQSQQRTQQQVVQGLTAGTESFRSKFTIENDLEFDRLQGAVASAGIFPAFVQTYGDVAVAIEKALEYQYWQDPTFRERELQRRIDATKESQRQHAARQRKAASVTGTGGNGASRTEAPAKNTDPWAQVAQGLREAQSNGQPT
jgi:hypothetical protein